MINKTKTEHVVKRLQIDYGFRRSICLRNHYWFFLTYFTRFIKYPCADMHKQMLYLSGVSGFKHMVVLGFPKCGKSLIHSYSLPLWSILNKESKTVVIVVNGKDEKTQFRDRFAKELMFNQKLLKDFELKYRKRGYCFFFPQYQAQVCIVDLQTESDIDLVVGATPELIIIDSLKPYAEKDKEETFKKLKKIFYEAGNKDTRKIAVGRGDGAAGPLMRLTTDMIAKKNDYFLPAFYPFCKSDQENPVWEGKFPDSKAIKEELDKPMTKEGFFFEYFLLAAIPEIPFKVDESSQNNAYPLDRTKWGEKLTEEQKKNIAELVLVPYQGEQDEGMVLWGIKETNGTIVLQGIEWQGEPNSFEIKSLAIETREWLDSINVKARLGLYGDLNDSFSNRVSRTPLDFKGQIITACQRRESEYRKTLVENFTACGKIQFHSDFAELIRNKTGSQKKFKGDWFNHIALLLNESVVGSIIFTTIK